MTSEIISISAMSRTHKKYPSVISLDNTWAIYIGLHEIDRLVGPGVPLESVLPGLNDLLNDAASLPRTPESMPEIWQASVAVGNEIEELCKK